MKIWQPYRAY